jgi:hypothetical protein
MRNRKLISAFLLAVCMAAGIHSLLAQQQYQPAKTGGWKISNGMSACDGLIDQKAFTARLTAVASWFHGNHPMLQSPKGFDMNVQFWNSCYSEEHRRACDFSTFGEVDFQFQLFLLENGKESKWVVEPPHWKIILNSARSGHGPNFGGLDGYRVQVDPPELEDRLDRAVVALSEFFQVFAVEREIAPGVRQYADGTVVVFDPARPDYWIPVTVDEVMQAKLAYWKIKPQDKMVYDFLRDAYSKFTSEELNSPAYEGSEDAITDVNGKGSGLQIMRFNPEYWNRSLPRSAIQFVTLYLPTANETEEMEFIRNNGHPDYVARFRAGVDATRLGELLKLQ